MKFIPKHFIIFNAIVNGILLNSLLYCLFKYYNFLLNTIVMGIIVYRAPTMQRVLC